MHSSRTEALGVVCHDSVATSGLRAQIFDADLQHTEDDVEDGTNGCLRNDCGARFLDPRAAVLQLCW